MAVENTETELLHYDMFSTIKSMYRERGEIISAAPTSLNKLIQQLKINSLIAQYT